MDGQGGGEFDKQGARMKEVKLVAEGDPGRVLCVARLVWQEAPEEDRGGRIFGER